MALCSDLLVIAADAKIGYPPARVWGSPTTSMWAYRLGPQRAKRLLFTGDSLSGAEALEWGLAIEAPPPDAARRAHRDPGRADRADAAEPAPDDEAARQPVAATRRACTQTQVLGTVFDGITRHTTEGYAFQQRAAEAGFSRPCVSATSRSATPAPRPSRAERLRCPPSSRRRASGCCTRARRADRGGRLRRGLGGRDRAARRASAAGTLYRHFPSKGELFVELFREVCGARSRRWRAAASQDAGRAVERLEPCSRTFAERALRNPRLAWALIAEPVDPLVDAERLDYRRSYRDCSPRACAQAIVAGEVPEQDPELTAAALVGGVGEALVGPLSPLVTNPPPSEQIVAALRTFARRAVGAAA